MTPAAWREKEQTVAVVVAHGIGNQLPMDTLRSMVDNVFGVDSGLADPAPVYSRLDRDADFLDLRRLMLTKTGQRPRVDFYELYWQPTFGSGSAGAVIGWAVKLLLRRGKIGEQMRQVVKTVWIAFFLGLLVIALLAALGAVARSAPTRDGRVHCAGRAAPRVRILAVQAPSQQLAVQRGRRR